MSDLRLHGDGADAKIVDGLRAIHAPPGGESYWRGLEARILARVAQAGLPEIAWWSELGRWARPALVAAAMLLFAAGVAMFRTSRDEEQVAYDAMLTPAPLPVETVVRPVLQGEREAAFRYLLTQSGSK